MKKKPGVLAADKVLQHLLCRSSRSFEVMELENGHNVLEQPFRVARLAAKSVSREKHAQLSPDKRPRARLQVRGVGEALGSDG